jgi:4-amino-4-deoxy-L-arabinose transferase-like glycosyltransferase
MTSPARRARPRAPAAPPAGERSGPAPQGSRRGLAAVLATAFVLRAAAVLWLADTIPYSDYFYYHEAGRMQAEDALFFLRSETVQRYVKLAWWPPGYPVFLGAVYSLFGPNFRLAVALQVLMGTLVCGLVYGIGRRAAGRRAGLAAGLLAAVNPTWIFMTNLTASENLYVLWLALALWLAGRSVRPRAHAWTGVAMGLGALTRAIGLLVPVVVAFWMRGRQGADWRRTCAWMLTATALAIAPWTLRNAVVAGTPAIVCFGGGLNFWFGHNDGELGYREVSRTPMAGLENVADVDRRGWELGFEYLARHPLGFFSRGARKVGALFAPPTPALHANSAILVPDSRHDPSLEAEARATLARQRTKDALLHGPLLVAAALHSYVLLAGALVAALLFWRRLPGEMRLAAWVAIYWVAAHVVFWAQSRFRYPMELPLALLAGFALSRLGSAPELGLPSPAAAARRRAPR